MFLGTINTMTAALRTPNSKPNIIFLILPSLNYLFVNVLLNTIAYQNVKKPPADIDQHKGGYYLQCEKDYYKIDYHGLPYAIS